ncbi:DMT family transporter [Marivita cryptomonadis]|uniref:DMT family transporter n=2 Tax=Roseobacteraceae TaxID=2854170 RepID=A0A9Q2S3N4_9RHOB|nr:DMT family transporter [Marivita cryptomonadis]MBM2329909.1 DMT family transporter [Marivita cryptomonadis]MBM2339496.1 DMT family transporter [Marivita cryptomonadis]MBM2344155.1 DMT family transporter [Marivita cryptomonadis]MBM2348833.1 DMT family transporter [Marivita cryptomonadis]
MVMTGICFVAVTALVKTLGGRIPAAESAFLRYVIGLVFLIPVWRELMAIRLTPRQKKLFGIRGIVHTLGVILWFYAMTRIPIAEVTAMNYLNPVYVSILAVFLLGERMALRRVLAVIAALIGSLIILRPGFRELDPGHIAMLGTALLFAGSYLIAKIVSGELPASLVVALLSITVTIGLAPFAIAVWVTPSLADLGVLAAIACFATAGHYTMTLAFAAAPVTVTQPVTFLQLVWSVLLGALFFGEPADPWVILGGGIIMASVIFITWREAVLRKSHRTPLVNETKG